MPLPPTTWARSFQRNSQRLFGSTWFGQAPQTTPVMVLGEQLQSDQQENASLLTATSPAVVGQFSMFSIGHDRDWVLLGVGSSSAQINAQPINSFGGLPPVNPPLYFTRQSVGLWQIGSQAAPPGGIFAAPNDCVPPGTVFPAGHSVLFMGTVVNTALAIGAWVREW